MKALTTHTHKKKETDVFIHSCLAHVKYGKMDSN